jgi:3-dehydroquinate synthase
MNIQHINFSGQLVTYCIGESFSEIKVLFPTSKIVYLVDDIVFAKNEALFTKELYITINATEENKTQATVDFIIGQMLNWNIDKSYMLVGVGGGVVTDIAGYIASIYKRGIKLGLVPTTILGMTDAAIGGKNGVNVGLYKNMVGTIHRPTFILFDFTFLDTLPKAEWINGFAEIIKHACIKDVELFATLEQYDIDFYINNKEATATLIEKNINIKTAVVLQDQFETEERFLLNFGHTFGHAIENTNKLPHGHAVSLGMIIAAKISEEINNFPTVDKERLIKILEQYSLPTNMNVNMQQALDLLKKDKKADGDGINFVLLKKIGASNVIKIPFVQLEDLADQIL